MARNKHKWESAMLNNDTYRYYYETLKSLAINRFEWTGLPDTCDERFLEIQLFEKGYCLFFQDIFINEYLTLPCTISGKWNVYNIPIDRQAYASNGYKYDCTDKDSVIIWNNYQHKPLHFVTRLFALRLYEIERSIDVNVRLQKYPAIVKSSEEQRLTMQNLMKDYQGNEPFIFANKSLDLTGLEVLDMHQPFVADKLDQLKMHIMNQYLTRIGVENSNNDKKERMVSDEVGSNYGSVEAFRNLGLNSRLQARDQINEMFGLNVDVKYRSVLPTMVNASMNPIYKVDARRELQEGEGEGLE